MKTYIRKWVKDEKRIVKLLYQKGLIKDSELSGYYWQDYRTGKRPRRKNKNGYRWTDRLPEVHYWTTDYFGESDEHSLVDFVIDGLYWGQSYENGYDEYGMPNIESNFKYKGRSAFIKHLELMPTINRSSRINSLLKINQF